MMKVDILNVRGTDRLAVWADFSARNHLKELPGALWNAEARAWTYPLGYPSAVSLGAAAGRLRMPVEPTEQAAAWVAEAGSVWGAVTSAGAVVAAEGVPGFYGHQVACASWLAMDGIRGRLDTSQTGSGKTRSALRAAWECWRKGERGILLVSTLLAVKNGWAEEIAAVADLLPLEGAAWDARVLSGSVSQRRKQIAAAVEASEKAGGVGVVLIVNHEQLKTHSRLSGYGDIALSRCPACGGVREGDGVVKESACHAHEKEFNKMEFVAVVLDECHRYMNPSSQTTRAGWYLCDRAPRVWGLTGTPGSRDVMANQWALLRLVWGADWPPRSTWTAYFAQCGYDVHGFWEIGRLRPEREPEFRVGYAGLTRRILKEQVLDLPPLLRGGTLVHRIGMSGEQARVYREMADRMRLEVAEGEVTAQNALAVGTRLSMLANAVGIPGPKYGELEGYDKDGNPVFNTKMELRAPSNKIDYVVDMFGGVGGVNGVGLEPGTVFQAVHPVLLELLRDALVAKKIIARADDFGLIIGSASEAARTLARTRFQAGKIPYLGFTTGAGGTGITLTRASVMVALERPWSPIQYAQAQDRVHRIGSEIHETVSIIDVVTAGTVEERIIDRLAENAESMEDVLRDKDRVRGLLFG